MRWSCAAPWGDDGFRPETCGLPAGSFLVGLASIPWREAWKYGERAFRYCQHDAGHALAALGLAAARLGWTARRLEGVGSGELAELLGLDADEGPEFEHAEALVAVAPGPWSGRPADRAITGAGALARSGQPAERTPSSVAGHQGDGRRGGRAGGRRLGGAGPARTGAGANDHGEDDRRAIDRHLDAATLIRGRRSAVAMDGHTTLPAPAFFRLLSSLLPASRRSGAARRRRRGGRVADPAGPSRG